MSVGKMPAAEVDVTEDLVRRLLAAQHPDLADRPLTVVANGWDNVIVRVGDDLVARVPRRREGAALVEHEQRWLPTLASRLPIPIAAPVRVGRPTDDYPWSWSICPWFEGEVAADAPLADPDAEADRLAAFVAELHAIASGDAPVNPFRGQPLRSLLDRLAGNLPRLDDRDLADRIRQRADGLAATPEWDGPPVWLHGDLHTANVVVRRGSIVAVLDFGDVTSGDPAVDLAIAWMLFDDGPRDRFRAGAGPGGAAVDDDTWARAQVWGLHFAVLYLLHSADTARFARMGSTLLDRLLRHP